MTFSGKETNMGGILLIPCLKWSRHLSLYSSDVFHKFYFLELIHPRLLVRHRLCLFLSIHLCSYHFFQSFLPSDLVTLNEWDCLRLFLFIHLCSYHFFQSFFVFRPESHEGMRLLAEPATEVTRVMDLDHLDKDQYGWQQFMKNLVPYCCKVSNTVYVEVTWVSPFRIRIENIFFLKREKGVSFLKQVRSHQRTFDADTCGIRGEEGSRPTKFEVTINEDWPRDPLQHQVRELTKWPYETFLY